MSAPASNSPAARRAAHRPASFVSIAASLPSSERSSRTSSLVARPRRPRASTQAAASHASARAHRSRWARSAPLRAAPSLSCKNADWLAEVDRSAARSRGAASSRARRLSRALRARLRMRPVNDVGTACKADNKTPRLFSSNAGRRAPKPEIRSRARDPKPIIGGLDLVRVFRNAFRRRHRYRPRPKPKPKPKPSPRSEAEPEKPKLVNEAGAAAAHVTSARCLGARRAPHPGAGTT